MEILSLLETKIESTLLKVKSLEEENRRLRQEVDSGLSELEQENRKLREDLERERSSKDEVRNRIDTLLSKLQDETL